MSPLKRNLLVFIYLVSISWPATAEAASRAEDFQGLNRSFTTGYSFREYAQSAREAGTYEVLVSDEQKSKDAESAVADVERHLDQWRYSRRASYSGSYSSNAGGAYNDPRGEVVHVYAGGFGMTRRQKHNFVELFYDVTYRAPVINEKGSELTHVQHSRLGYEFGRLKLTFENTYSPVAAYATGDRTELDTTGTSRVTAFSDTFTADVDYRVSPKLNADFRWTYSLFSLPAKYNSPDAFAFGTETQKFRPTVTYLFSPRFSAYVTHEWEFVTYPEGGRFNARAKLPTVGIGGRLSPKTTYRASVTEVDRHYTRGFQPADYWAYSGAITRRLTSKITGTLSVSKESKERFPDNAPLYEDNWNYGLDFAFRMSPKITFDLGGSAALLQTQEIFEFPDLENPSVSYLRQNERQVYEWGATVTWAPKPYFSTMLAYQYLNRNGSFKQQESQEHIVSTSAKATF